MKCVAFKEKFKIQEYLCFRWHSFNGMFDKHISVNARYFICVIFSLIAPWNRTHCFPILQIARLELLPTLVDLYVALFLLNLHYKAIGDLFSKSLLPFSKLATHN